MNTTWKIENLERDHTTGLINKVNWAIVVSDDTHETIIRNNVNLEQSDNFIEFNSVTEEMIVSWVKQFYGESNVTGLETLARDTFNYEKSLPEQTPNTSIAFGLPW
jgi:hypothetical protein